MLIVCYRMEELVTLHYGNFSILGEWVREFTQSTSCSNWVANQNLYLHVEKRVLKALPSTASC